MKRLLRFLSGLWGALAAVTALFPGAATLLGAPIPPKESLLKTYYTAVPPITASFCLLLLTTYQARLRQLEWARALAVRAFGASVLLLFAFIGVKHTWLDRKITREYLTTGHTVVREVRSHGLVTVETTHPRKSEVVPERETATYGEPVDLLAVAVLTCAFAALTVAFGVLGLHAYYTVQPNEGAAGDGQNRAAPEPPGR